MRFEISNVGTYRLDGSAGGEAMNEPLKNDRCKGIESAPRNSTRVLISYYSEVKGRWCIYIAFWAIGNTLKQCYWDARKLRIYGSQVFVKCDLKGQVEG